MQDIATSLDSLEATASTIPELGTLLAGVDTSLSQVLLGLEILLAGVLNLVAALYVLLFYFASIHANILP